MIEMCGIISSDEITADQHDGHALMRNSLSTSNDSKIKSEIHNWAEISVISNRINENKIKVYKKETKIIYVITLNNNTIRNNSEFYINEENGDYKTIHLIRDLQPPFAVIMLNTKFRSLKIINDQYGMIPIYYSIQNNTFTFSTKINPLLNSGLTKWKLEQKALIDLFTYEHVTGDHTLADSVFLLPPAKIFKFKAGHYTAKNYMKNIADEYKNNIVGSDDAIEVFYNELNTSVNNSILNHSRIAIALSGGMDSRALLGCAIKNSSNIKTYTFGQFKCSDIQYAKKLSKICNVEHKVIRADGSHLLRWIDYGIFITSGMVSCIHYHILNLADVLSSEADVVLDGLGGDALTGSHLSNKMFNAYTKEIAINEVYRQRATGWKTLDERKKIFTSDFIKSCNYDPKSAINKHFKNDDSKPLWYGCHLFDLYERQRRFIQFGPQLIRNIIDTKTPFYSVNLVEFLKRLEAYHLKGQRTYRNMHKKYLSLLARKACTPSGIPISWPDQIRTAKQVYNYACRNMNLNKLYHFTGFRESTNYPKWFRENLKKYIRECLLDKNTEIEGILKKRSIEMIVKEHMSGKIDHTVKLGCLLTFINWYKTVKKSER